ncbi:hypothetical protein [Aliivibrio salmonicida]|uniref:hypothetical protein n=1 Tax=Aliivibrio salmonicida TaxID=40269 RepID=UPI001E5EC85B|nr:hypothetical protein [Aliivibrio salmonicida]
MAFLDGPMLTQQHSNSLPSSIAATVEDVRTQSTQVHQMIKNSESNIEQLRLKGQDLELLLNGLKA